MDVINYYQNKLPILGICLGHQAIAEYFGGKIKKGTSPMHGTLSEIICKEDSLFDKIPSKINVVRYHSLIVEQLPAPLSCIAQTLQQDIMALKHDTLPIYGLQFHPEAALTEFGIEILKNWLKTTKISG
jgi:anthranilate synthase component 2